MRVKKLKLTTNVYNLRFKLVI